MRAYSDLKIAVAGTGYVGLSIAILLAQHHEVMAVDIVPERVQKINNKQATIHDDYVEKYLRKEKLRLTATLDAKSAYGDADYVIVATPTNYDSRKNFFDTSAVEEVIKMVTQSIDSFVNNDLHMARSVIISDDVVDNYFYDIKMKLIDLIGTDPQSGEEYVDILMIAKYLERIGDHATNIAGWVEYSILGKHVDNAGEESN